MPWKKPHQESFFARNRGESGPDEGYIVATSLMIVERNLNAILLCATISVMLPTGASAFDLNDLIKVPDVQFPQTPPVVGIPEFNDDTKDITIPVVPPDPPRWGSCGISGGKRY